MRARDRWLLAGLIAVAGLAGLVSYDRASRLRYDFRHFYLDAEFVWRNGGLNPLLLSPNHDAQRQLPFYLPAVSVLIAPLGALGPAGGAAAWTAIQVGSLAASLWVLAGWHAGAAPAAPAGAVRLGPLALATACALPALIVAAQFNQLTLPVLALLLLALQRLERGAPWQAGALLAAATLIKLLPAVFLPWLVLKRQWGALAGFVVAFAGLAAIPPLAMFGPERTITYHRQWWEHNAGGAAAQGMVDDDLDEHFTDRRNQSIATVIARLCWPEHPHATRWQPLSLDRQTCLRLALGITAGLALVLAWLTRVPWIDLGAERRRCEFAVYCIAMLVLSPLLRQYYLAWVLPALVLISTGAGCESHRRRRGAWTGLGLWVLAMALWAWRPARLYGAHLLILIVIAAVQFWVFSLRLPENRAARPRHLP
ncbi:MAG TPA: glycosyltransferase 87 family protein [Phycisphaerae bacterium]|nr:glycosyltransferase 87 family protein [Phycisphaerae bacterium]